ncbi:hypothetical protein ACFQT0_21610 [Hymenobacter humi]|uniref:DUF433 domain-containing protein n=1 Tax=Hymenobacter humi TaxID=1411620 RepID=A0ABW2U835_9BACT
MAGYYELRLPSDPKIIGVRNGIMQVEICDEVFLSAIRPVLFNGTEVPLSDEAKAMTITCLRVLPRAKLTDVLSFGPSLTWCPFLVKRTTLSLLSTFHIRITHVFPVALDPDPQGLNEYALAFIQPLWMDFIDFPRSTYYTGSDILNNKQRCVFSTKEEYIKRPDPLALPERIVLAPHFDLSLDLFYLVGCGICVSERLKQALEQEKTSGVKIFSTMIATAAANG